MGKTYMSDQQVDILLVGAGVMSATLAAMLKELDPLLSIRMIERLPIVAGESSGGWNNAGTGHAGYCELNYTPQNKDGSVTIDRALSINAAFETSLQFWAYLVEQNILKAKDFINPTPHLSFVWGQDNVTFLKKRFDNLSKHPLFQEMKYSEDVSKLKQWMPLIMNGRDNKPVAATRIEYGTDVDFGALTRGLISHLQKQPDFGLHLNQSVRHLKQDKRGIWHVNIQDRISKKSHTINAKFVFLGAGGGALPLLQKSRIPESKGYGGFPVSGLWLVCKNQDIIKQHHAKVYGTAAIGAPPMSVPHLDTRIIDGQPALLFGPYAGFTTKFLKEGSFLDFVKSFKINNLKSMVVASLRNIGLTRYLIGEVFQSPESRIKSLQQYFPNAKAEDWHLAQAGQRVQIIKKCHKKGGKLEFGTEIVTAKDGSIAALLGASPGASTSVQAMTDVISLCFSDRIQTLEWKSKMRTMVPSYGKSLIDDPELLKEVRTRTLRTLQLNQETS
jgi:malate dehydrogenase (quinone)